MVVDEDGTIVLANAHAEKLFGYRNEELLQQPVEIVIPESFRQAHVGLRELFFNHLEQRIMSPGRELYARRKDGTQFPAEIALNPIEVDDGKWVLASVVDTSERKKAEQALREHAEKLDLHEKALKGAEEIIVVVDRDHRHVIVNRAYLNQRQLTREQVVGQPLWEVLDKGIYETAIKEKLDRCFRGEVVRYEMRYTHPERCTKDLLISYLPLDGPTGVERVACIAQDITELKKAARALRDSEDKFRTVFQGAPAGMAMLSPEGRFLAVNAALCEFLGYSEGELLSIDVLSITHPDDKAVSSRAMERALGGSKPERFEKRYIHKNGQVQWGELTTIVIRDIDGKPEYFLSQLLNVTERKRAEQELRESEERFRLVANAAPVMIWMSGPDKLCNYCNQPWLEFTGRPLEAELGNGWTESVHPNDLPYCLHTYNYSVDDHASFRMTYRVRRHDGEYRWIEDTGVPIVSADGSFRGCIGSRADITDRKREEEILRTVSGKLIEAQEKERRRVARELHDDINQRLALLVIGLQRLKGLAPVSAVGLREQADELSNRVTKLSSDIHLLSHHLHSSNLDYLGLVPAINGLCKEITSNQNVEVEFTCSNVPSQLHPNIALGLFRVLQEALWNAVKHSGAQKVEARLLGLPGEIQLTIRDRGKGFDPEATMTGQGLGLVSMQERVHLLKGSISIISKPMCGTEINVRIPVSHWEPASRDESAEPTEEAA